MNFLFDLQHPAHLHFFRNLIARLQNEKHNICITGRDKDILVELANNYGIDISIFGTAKKGILNLGKELLYRQWHLYKIIKKFKPDMMMAVAGTYISLLGKLTNIPTYIFYNNEHAIASNLLAYPFATCIYVPKCYRKKIYWNHVRYNGYHELAYLHPNYFKPDPNILKKVGLEKNEIFSIVRFVGWEAGHDIGLLGLSYKNKIQAINELNKYGRVFISSEKELPLELKKYKLKLNVTEIHDLMSYASLIFGESATMTSEGAILGVPSIYLDPIGRGYTDEQKYNYGIVFNFNQKQQLEAIKKASSILSNYKKNYWRAIGKRIIEEKIDVTDMIYKIATNKSFVD